MRILLNDVVQRLESRLVHTVEFLSEAICGPAGESEPKAELDHFSAGHPDLNFVSCFKQCAAVLTQPEFSVFPDDLVIWPELFAYLSIIVYFNVKVSSKNQTDTWE